MARASQNIAEDSGPLALEVRELMLLTLLLIASTPAASLPIPALESPPTAPRPWSSAAPSRSSMVLGTASGGGGAIARRV